MTTVSQHLVTFRRAASAALVASCLFAMSAPTALAGPALAGKEFAIDGILDCGQESGRVCELGDTITLITGDKRSPEVIIINVSWIRGQIRAFKQDDSVFIEIRELPDGTYQALAIGETPSGGKRQHGPDDTAPAQDEEEGCDCEW
ncbi:MAG: hypothetical protein U0821_25620 [Chloroflexota bacterium]